MVHQARKTRTRTKSPSHKLQASREERDEHVRINPNLTTWFIESYKIKSHFLIVLLISYNYCLSISEEFK